MAITIIRKPAQESLPLDPPAKDSLFDLGEFIEAHKKTFTPRSLSNANNKWLVRSALQKAIRRGQVERALSCAGLLFSLNENYAFKSLGICAIEDVGVGNPRLLNASVQCQRKETRDKFGPIACLSALTIAAATSLKSRTLCEISCWGDPLLEESFKNLSSCSGQDLLESALSEDPVVAYVAAHVLRGNTKSSRREGSWAKLIAKMKELPEPLGEAAVVSMQTPVDSMAMSIPVVFRAYLKSLKAEGVKVQEDQVPPSEVIGSVASEAYDQHNYQGKIAIKAFHTSMSKDYPIIAAKDVKALGEAVFIVEGSKVDRRIINPPFIEWLKSSIRAEMPFGQDAELNEYLAAVEKEIPRLNEKRKWAITSFGH